jgi:TonB family protein
MLTLITVLFLMFAPQDNVLHRAPLDYPRAAMEKGIQGSVVVEVNLDEEGLVTDARALSGPQELRSAALRSVLDWHFSKQMHLPAVTQVTVDFTLPERRPSLAKAPNFPARIEERRIEKIDIQGLTGPAREALLARLPVHEGANINGELFERVVAEAQSFDEHLRVMLQRKPAGVTLEIALRAPQPNFIGSPSALARAGLEATTSSTRIKVSGSVQQAKLIRQPRPVYPVEAKMARIQGVVRMNAVIGKDGAVKELQLVMGVPELAQAAMDAVKQWVYEPTLLNGAPVEVITQIDVNFTLSI